MSTEITPTSIDPQERADFAVILRCAMDGKPVDPEIARRVQERAAHVTAEIRRFHGEIDEDTLNQLLRTTRDES